MGLVNIVHGDCMNVMETLPACTYSLAIADPPFNIGWNGYDGTDDNKEKSAYLNWCQLWMLQVRRLLNEYGTFWLSICDEYVSELDMIAKDIGFNKRSHVVWYYTFGNARQDNFTRSHDHWLYYTKHPKIFTFNADEIRVPSDRQLKYNDKRANQLGKLPDNTWTYNRICGNHPERITGTTPQTPEKLIERIVLSTSHPGADILDPFSGTGTVPVVAERLGRRCTAIEISEKQCEKINQRVINAQKAVGV